MTSPAINQTTDMIVTPSTLISFLIFRSVSPQSGYVSYEDG
jgi:hypothetical protein